MWKNTPSRKPAIELTNYSEERRLGSPKKTPPKSKTTFGLENATRIKSKKNNYTIKTAPKINMPYKKGTVMKTQNMPYKKGTKITILEL